MVQKKKKKKKKKKFINTLQPKAGFVQQKQIIM